MLLPASPNTPAIDYRCPTCESSFQLKAQSRPFSGRIVDAAYSTMMRAINENRTPNLFVLHYNLIEWKVANLLLIPRFAFPASAIEQRPPLAATARRAGWIGCNILLAAIPMDARIAVVVGGRPSLPSAVRMQYARVRPLAGIQPEQRGWVLDVLNAVRDLNQSEFSLADVYEAEDRLAALHPANKHVRAKIRQQLQALRDVNLIEFLGHGRYRFRST